MVTHVITGSRKRLGIGLLALFVLLGAMAGGLAAVAWRPAETPLRLGKERYTVRVVASEAARERGLSGTVSLPENRGMLFVFDENGQWGIWMKDMHYPIDILWLDQSKTVVDMVENVSPATYPAIFKPKAPARYVLELAAGSIAKTSIVVGSQASFNASMLGGARS